jgi:hypothetical protein
MHRIRKNYPKIHTEAQKILNNQNKLDKNRNAGDKYYLISNYSKELSSQKQPGSGTKSDTQINEME